jgi:hypothetical protein
MKDVTMANENEQQQAVDPVQQMMDDDQVEGQWKSGEKKPETDNDADEGEEKPEADSDADEGEEKPESEADDEEEPVKKPKKTASERIKELNRLLGEERRTNRALQQGYEARLERLEKGLPAQKTDDSKVVERIAPDPDDLEKYPLGRLDDRYIEDKMDYLSDLKIDKALGSVLQRQQESDMQAEAERMAADAKTKIATLSEKGEELYDDFVEVAVKAAFNEEYRLDEPTFFAINDAEHGAQILYNLAKDKAEAARVAGLTPYQQVKYVMDKDAEIAGKAKPRLPKAGDPPKNVPKGTNARYSVAGDTDDMEAFGREVQKYERSRGM